MWYQVSIYETNTLLRVDEVDIFIELNIVYAIAFCQATLREWYKYVIQICKWPKATFFTIMLLAEGQFFTNM